MIKRTAYYADNPGLRIIVYVFLGEPRGELAVWRLGARACELIWTQDLAEMAIFIGSADRGLTAVDVYMQEVMLNIAAAQRQ